MKSIAGCILAGGNGSRAQGQDKCMFVYQGRTFLERSMEVFLTQEECILSYNRDINAVATVLAGINEQRQALGRGSVTVIPDAETVAGIGPMAGLYSVISRMRSEAVIVTPCDVPFFQRDMVRILLEQYQIHPEADSMVMTSEGRLQPLCGIYTRKVLPALEDCIAQKQYKPRCLLEQVNTLYLQAEEYGLSERAFMNINTLEELQKLNAIVDKADENGLLCGRNKRIEPVT